MNLADRYPDIQFLLTFMPHKKVRLSRWARQFNKWLNKTPLESIEILYVTALIDYPLPDMVTNWLAEKSERALVFIEPRLGAFAAFKRFELLDDPQIHFCYAETDPVEQLAESFPSERIAIFEGMPFDSLALKRRSAAFSALYSDVLYSHKIVDNVLSNMRHLNQGFDLTGLRGNVPLIICGAGPSLERAIPILKQEQNRALILAVGSAVAVLTKRGVRPHLAMALDPNDNEFKHLAQGEYFEGPFIFSPRLHRDVFSTSNGPFGYLQSDTGGLIEHYIDKELELHLSGSGPDLGSEAFSVTTLAVSWASAQGFSDVFFTGVDLAFSAGRRYADGVEGSDSRDKIAATLDQVIIRRDINGKRCETLVKWVMESEVISTFAKEHPEMRFVNCSMEGLGFEGIDNCSLESLILKYKERDLRGIIHSLIQEQPLHFDNTRYGKLVDELNTSIEKCASLCEAILKEKSQGKRILLISDFQEEKAYEALLAGIDHTLDHLLVRYHPHLNPESIKEKREESKYRELKRQILLFGQIVERLAKNSSPSVL